MAGPRKPAGAGASAERIVRLSVPLPAWAYARLGVLADLEGRARAAIAAEVIMGSLAGVEAKDGRKGATVPATGQVDVKL